MRYLKWIVCALLLAAGPTLAGPFEDGVSAYERQDYGTALRLWRPLAQAGRADAQFNLGLMFADGLGVPKDDQQAVFWYRKAAEQGYAPGQSNLGNLYFNGRGVPKDDQQAVFWFRKGAEQGNAPGQTNLGGMYVNGQGVPKDDQQAVFWYRKAAEQGDAVAQHYLGTMYNFGQGVTKDDQQAVFWYRKAAAQGHAGAQFSLGNMYAGGQGVPKDDQQAVFWYRKAAEQGDARAQLNFGTMYAGGTGVPKDDQQAYFWSLLASVGGAADAVRNRDLLERRLTPNQRARAQADARDWKPKAAAPVGSFATNREPGAAPPYMPAQREAASSTGSGFYIASGRVVTNHHVTEGCSRLRVGGQSEGRLLSIDARNDLALIALQSGATEQATVRAGRVKVGESALVAGFPLSGFLSGFNVTTGNVSSLAGFRGDTRLLQITAPVQAGNSGGPLLDASGTVMGVVVSKLNALKVAEFTGDVPQNVNFAINANVLASFLDANGVDYKSSPGGAAIPTQEAARRAQAFTVLVECWK